MPLVYAPRFYQGFDESFSGQMLDAVNIHPLPNLGFHGRTYQLGNFMSKELFQLAEFRDFFLATYGERKPTISDEDNDASMYRDVTGWTIHRKRAWMAVMCGAHYDYIDFSIQVGGEAGQMADQRRNIRTWMKNLSELYIPLTLFVQNPRRRGFDTPCTVVEIPSGLGETRRGLYRLSGRRDGNPDAAAGRSIMGPIRVRSASGSLPCLFLLTLCR